MFLYPKKNYAPTTKLPRRQIIKAVSEISGVSQEKVKKVIDAYDYVIYEAICIGYKVAIKNIGTFEPLILRGRQEGTYFNIHTREYYNREEPKEDFIKPDFRFTEDFLYEVRERTRGKVKAPPAWKDRTDREEVLKRWKELDEQEKERKRENVKEVD